MTDTETSAAADEEEQLLQEIEACEVRLRLVLGPANDTRRVETFVQELLERRTYAEERLAALRSERSR